MSDWQNLIPVADLETGDVTPVKLGRRQLAVYDCNDEIFVSAALCTHGGAPLCDGYLDGYVIECPLHQGCFDIRNGNPLDAPVTRALQVFPARIFDGMVQFKIPQ